MGVALAATLYFYAKSQPVLYSTSASLYPLTASEGNQGGGLLASLRGGADISAGLSDEASLGLEDLANSRSTKEAVVLTKLPAFGNRTIASLLIEEENKHLPLFGTKINMPTNEVDLRGIGVYLLSKSLTAKTNKNGLFIISISSTDPALLSPVAYTMAETVTDFYTELKVKKARSDYNFTNKKIDSLKREMNSFDRKAVEMNNTTMFTSPDKIEYTIPKENLINDKTRIVSIYNGASNNREEALWRLQRATPILAVLDKPEAPFGTSQASAKLYAIGGFILGCILGIIVFLIDILYKYSKLQVNNALFGSDEEQVEVVVEEEALVINDTKNTSSTL